MGRPATMLYCSVVWFAKHGLFCICLTSIVIIISMTIAIVGYML